MAKESMSKKMYKNSPTLETDDSGKKYIKKNTPTDAEKKSGQTNDGTDGMQMHEVHQKQEREMFDMFQKQHKEFRDMHDRHRAEMLASDADGATGDEMINKVQDNSKE